MYILFIFRIIIYIRISVEIWVNAAGIVVTMQILYYTIFNRGHHFAAKSCDCEGLQMHFLIHAFSKFLNILLDNFIPKAAGRLHDSKLFLDLNLDRVLSDKSLEEMEISSQNQEFIRTEIKLLLSKTENTEQILAQCNFDLTAVRDFFWERYCEDKGQNQSNFTPEYEKDMKRALAAVTEALLSLTKERQDFQQNLDIQINATVNTLLDVTEKICDNTEQLKQQVPGMVPLSVPLHSGNVKHLYHINKDFIDSFLESSYLAESKSHYYRLCGRIEEILLLTLHHMVLPYEELVQYALSCMEQEIFITPEESIPGRVFFITGNGGMGKTTLLSMLALKTAKRTDTDVYVMQLNGKDPEQLADDVIHVIEKSSKAVLFIDNPYDNLDIALRLLDYVRTNKNVWFVCSERYNRLAQMFQNADTAFASDISNALILEDVNISKSQKSLNRLDFVRKDNISHFPLPQAWKRQLVEKMISYSFTSGTTPDEELLQKLLEQENYRLSPCESFLRVCLKYNQSIQDKSFELNLPFRFDWNEWEILFASGNGFQPVPGAPSLKNVFPYLAAFGLYKIPVTAKFIANLLQVHEVDIKSCLREKLPKTEPAYFDGTYITLKHDIIADLYFLANEHQNPHSLLMDAISYLDEPMVISFEKYILSARIIRGKKTLPHKEIDTISLLKKFGENPAYIEYLETYNRIYSYQSAKVFALINSKNITEETFQKEMENLLKELPKCPQKPITIWIICFMACMETEFFPPDSFFSIADKIDYHTVTYDLSNFEKYTRNKGYSLAFYYKIARKIYEQIAREHPADFPSHLFLARVLEAQNCISEAAALLKEIADSKTSDNFKACVAYATLYKKQYISLYKQLNSEITENQEQLWIQLQTYSKNAETYYRTAAELAEEGEKPRPLCALANFLFTVIRSEKNVAIKQQKFQEAENLFLEALQYRTNNHSAYTGLATLYGRTHSWNKLYNPSKADEYFRNSIEGCPKNLLVTSYVPWGNLKYCIGDLDSAKEKYKEALKANPREERAIKALELIEKEEQKRNALLEKKTSGLQSFDHLYVKTTERTPAGFRTSRTLKTSLFQDPAARQGILRLVYASLLSEALSPDDLENCKITLHNLKKLGGFSEAQNFLYLRAVQRLQLCCYEFGAAPYLPLDEERHLAHTAFLHFKRYAK